MIIEKELTCFFPAGAQSQKEIEITQVKSTQVTGVYTGYVLLPSGLEPEKVVIYQLLLNGGGIDLRLVSAKCPHKGADISADGVKNDGNVYCSVHRRPICIYSEYNLSYSVIKRNNQFYIAKSE